MLLDVDAGGIGSIYVALSTGRAKNVKPGGKLYTPPLVSFP